MEVNPCCIGNTGASVRRQAQGRRKALQRPGAAGLQGHKPPLFSASGRSRRKPLFSGISAVFNRPKKQLDIKSCGPGAPTLAQLALLRNPQHFRQSHCTAVFAISPPGQTLANYALAARREPPDVATARIIDSRRVAGRRLAADDLASGIVRSISSWQAWRARHCRWF
jgi:hypothetical protein